MNQINKYINKGAEFVENNHKLVFFIILIIAILINIYKFGEIPNEIHVDEAGMTYDAYSIANYGVDRFEKQNPVYFINFGGGQNALYTYLTAFLIKIFGHYNSIIIRIPALVISIIEVVVAYLLVKEFKSKKQALLFMFLVTISPWHIMKSRWGLESYLLSPLFLFSIYGLIKAIKSNKLRLLKFAISGLLFGITLYTYAISYIVLPVFLLLVTAYLLYIKKIHVKDAIAFSIPLLILAIPLILVQMVQKGWINEIDSFITIPKLFEYRTDELKFDINNVLSLQYGLFCDYLGYNSIKGYGVLYYFGTLAMLIGIIITIIKILNKTIIKNKGKTHNLKEISNKEAKRNKWKNRKEQNISLDVIMIITFISNLIIGFVTHINENVLNGILISATYFELVALREIYKKQQFIFSIVLAVYIISLAMFLKTYFTDFQNDYKRFHDNGAIDVINYVYKRFDNKDIYMDDKYNTYIYSLYVNPISPHEFNQNKEIKENEVAGYKNYHAYWNDEYDENSVYITKDENKAKRIIENTKSTLEIYKGFYIIYKI